MKVGSNSIMIFLFFVPNNPIIMPGSDANNFSLSVDSKSEVKICECLKSGIGLAE